MTRGAVLLFVGLGGGGAILGALLGEFAFSRGSGPYAAGAVGVVGLILAGMLLASRPREGARPMQEQEARAVPTPPPRAARRAAPAPNVRVSKSGKTDAKRRKGR